MSAGKWIWVNGRLRNARRPAVSAFDRGFLYGDGAYETLRVYDGRPFLFREHFRRWRAAAAALGIPFSLTENRLRGVCGALLKANGLREAILRWTLARGEGERGFDIPVHQRPTVVLAAFPVPPQDEKGIRLAIVPVRRNAAEALDPAVKSLNCLNNILAKREAARRKAAEAAMLNGDGFLTEGSSSNLFFRAGAVLKTPSKDCGILAGVTREAVIRLARRRGFRVAEGRFRPGELCAADEAFLTGSVREVAPVSSVVDETGRFHRLANGRPGVWTSALAEDYRRMTRGGSNRNELS